MVLPRIQGFRQGQSLTELTVAVFIILMALAAIATLVTVTVRGQRFAEETVVANNLAREGLEVARGLRDNAFTQGLRDAGCSSCTPPAYPTLPYPLPEPTPPAPDQEATVELDSTFGTWTLNFSGAVADFSGTGAQLCLVNNRYVQAQAGCPAGTGTRYRRRLTLEVVCVDPSTLQECLNTTRGGCPGSCAAGFSQFAGHRVRSRVSFPGHGCSSSTEGCVVLEDYLYAWK